MIEKEILSFQDISDGYILKNDPLGIGSYTFNPRIQKIFFDNPSLKDYSKCMILFCRVDGNIAARSMFFPTRVKIGDTVTILNTKTGEEEKYTIHKAYHDYKPSSMTGEPGKGYDIISYKDELLNTSDIDNGIILSESEFAQRLIGSYLGSTLQLIDDDLNEVKYIIKDIKKH